MQTMDRPVTDAGPPASTRRPWWLLAIAVTLALVVGVAGGWFLARATEGNPSALGVGGASLTERQHQMVDVLDKYEAAWRANDASAIMAFYAPGGYFSYEGKEYRVDDGSLAAFIKGASWSTLTISEPVLVSGDEVALDSTWNNTQWFNVIQFTATGDVLIVRHVSTA